MNAHMMNTHARVLNIMPPHHHYPPRQRRRCAPPAAVDVASSQPPTNSLPKTISFFATLALQRRLIPDARERAKRVKAKLIAMGPTYIKIGQFVSSRPDIFDEDTISELLSLQDNAPMFPSEVAQSIVSSEMGRPFEEVFADFESVPFAAASISQVHRARLKEDGRHVVVKIQRPFIRECFDADFASIRHALDILSVLTFCNLGLQRQVHDTKQLVEDCYRYLYSELSFRNEVDNMRMFKRILSKSNAKFRDSIVVPCIIPGHCTDKVITMCNVPSTKLAFDHARPEQAVHLMEFFLTTIMEFGVVHADPHPGNMGSVASPTRIVLYDFGQVVKLDPLFVRCMKPLLFAINDQDVPEIGRLLLESRAVLPMRDGKLEIHQLDFLVHNLIVYFRNVDFSRLKVSMANMPLTVDGKNEVNFQINPQLVMVFRSLSLLEGVCKSIDPHFSYFTVIANLMMKDERIILEAMDHRARKFLVNMIDASTLMTTTAAAPQQPQSRAPQQPFAASNTVRIIQVPLLAAAAMSSSLALIAIAYVCQFTGVGTLLEVMTDSSAAVVTSAASALTP